MNRVVHGTGTVARSDGNDADCGATGDPSKLKLTDDPKQHDADAHEFNLPLWKRALIARENQQDRELREARRLGRAHGLKVLAGQARARDLGVHIGRPSNQAVTAEVVERARELLATGFGVRATAHELGVPKSTLHRALQNRSPQNGGA